MQLLQVCPKALQRAVCWLLLLSLAGCVVPDYHLPGGYSSTYHRALRRQQSFYYPPIDAVEPSPTESGYWQGYRSAGIGPAQPQ